jgi:hypothetical protein
VKTLTLTSAQKRWLRALLERCYEYFDSPQSLRTLFADPPLLAWRSRLKEANDLSTRIDLNVDYLRQQFTTDGDNALVLLLWALAEQYPEPDARPDLLRALASELAYGVRAALPPNAPAGRELERKVTESNSMLDIRAWIKRLAEVERCVCKVAVSFGGRVAHGTGFLVAPDVVMTNYHVIQRVVETPLPSSSVTLQFDYRLSEDGTSTHVGPTYRLAERDWLIDSSPDSPIDHQPADDAMPKSDQLDYALLRVVGSPGSARVDSGGILRMSGSRGFLKLPDVAYGFPPGSPLIIVQHAEGKELKVAIETDAVLHLNGNGTRVRYRTNTEPGSSGSPCFDQHWNPVALHHSGDPDFKQRAQYNQGIPLAAIRRLLRQRGKLGVLGA